ncbi:hypothetical protein AZE42_08041 [Rhizopogon vesiculosus]|uniref:Uncharacterized protein n=1 Tax=Rhizopogon vesiculosus TaxID=180088 RepID=A0A1J8PGI5_9AGAM|nr:hypothetical protein AZE42_08041 [Rhizopogon vesiculosus]
MGADQLPRLHATALHIAAFLSMDSMDSSRYDESFSHAVLNSICSSLPSDHTIQSEDDIQFANAIGLLNFTKWPEGSNLKTCLLSKIQLLILRVLPTPNVDNLRRCAPYCNALVHFLGADQPPCLHVTALRITRTIRKDLVELSVARVDTLVRCNGLSQALLTIFIYADSKENSLIVYRDLHFFHPCKAPWL